MIKGIIFDFGNVIGRFDNDIFLEKISKYSDKTVEELNGIIYQESDLPKKYETGLISSDDFFIEICKVANVSISKEDFIEAYTNIFFPITETIELIERLSKKYKLGLLSNTSEWDFEYGIKKIAPLQFFSEITLSYEVGAMKPDEVIFRDSLKKMDLKPQECVFVDDIEKYVESAKQLGINGIHYTAFEKFISDLEKLGIEI